MQRKLSLPLFLLTLSFFSYHTNATTISKSRIHSPQTKPPPTTHIPTAPQHASFRAWCHKIPPYEKLCSKIIQTDPRSHLKSDPTGLVIILVDAAKANSNSAKVLLKDLLKKNRAATGGNRTTQEVIKDCLLAYGYVQADLKVSMRQLNSTDGRKVVADALIDADSELTYDCEWALQSFMFPLLDPMVKMVESFAAILRAACAILDLIN